MVLATKLSKLQRWILSKAFERHPAAQGGHRKESTGVPFAELFAELFPDLDQERRARLAKVESRYAVGYVTRLEILSDRFGLPKRECLCHEIIDRKAIDPDLYNRANASMYRALRRLKNRGLLVASDKKDLFQLTQEGIAVAAHKCLR